MLKHTWINGNKARIETGHKTFDKQCECLSTGNVVGTCQLGSFIRPSTELECNGRVNPPGHLQNFDLENFKFLPFEVRDYIKKMPRQVCLYELRSWGKKLAYEDRKKTVHAYIVTESYDRDYKLLKIFMVNNSQKSWNIANWCKDYISNP